MMIHGRLSVKFPAGTPTPPVPAEFLTMEHDDQPVVEGIFRGKIGDFPGSPWQIQQEVAMGSWTNPCNNYRL